MPYTYTRTFTRYWTDESPGMEKLKEAYQEIESDYIRRIVDNPSVDEHTKLAMKKRLETLMNAWYFMLEEIP